MTENPYQTKWNETRLNADNTGRPSRLGFEGISTESPFPAISPANTTLPRHISALLDMVLAAITGVVLAKLLPEEWLILPALVAAVIYFGYFFLFEALWGATPGKLMTGLKVVSFNGEPCSIKQIWIRTAMRIIEVNPFVFGALPGAARIVLSKNKQRFGDWFAGTIVVFRRHL